MEKHKLIIVGGGASGLMAGITALKNGVDDVLIIEKEEFLGGNLNLFINNDFGGFSLGKRVTGPELASTLISEYKSLGGKLKVNTLVLEIDKEKVIKYINPTDGIKRISADSIILASGLVEKYTGSIVVPVHKYTGIFTTASAHRLINQQGHLPGSNVLIYGNDIWTFILARRLLIEGANVQGIITSKGCLSNDILQIIRGFDLQVIYNTRIAEVSGECRIKSVKTINNIDGEIHEIECDSLVLSVSHYPNADYLSEIYKEIYKNEVVRNNYETSIKGIFCCGTLIDGMKSLLTSEASGHKVGKIVSEALKESL